MLLGFLYQRYVAGAKGLEQIPNYDFWRDFGSLQAVSHTFFITVVHVIIIDFYVIIIMLDVTMHCNTYIKQRTPNSSSITSRSNMLLSGEWGGKKIGERKIPSEVWGGPFPPSSFYGLLHLIFSCVLFPCKGDWHRLQSYSLTATH